MTRSPVIAPAFSALCSSFFLLYCHLALHESRKKYSKETASYIQLGESEVVGVVVTSSSALRSLANRRSYLEEPN